MTSKQQREQALKDYRSALEQIAGDDDSQAAIVVIEWNNIEVMKYAAKKNAADWLRDRGHEDFAAVLEAPCHEVFFAAVVVNDGGITVSHMRKAGR
jgi:hypothetical protein